MVDNKFCDGMRQLIAASNSRFFDDKHKIKAWIWCKVFSVCTVNSQIQGFGIGSFYVIILAFPFLAFEHFIIFY